MSAFRAALSFRVPLAAGRHRPTAGEAELAVIAPSREASVKGRLLGPVAAGFVTVAVYGLLATSFVTGLALRLVKGSA